VHLLLVEDHADTAQVMARMLRRSGFQVTVASTIAQALAEAEAARKTTFAKDAKPAQAEATAEAPVAEVDSAEGAEATDVVEETAVAEEVSAEDTAEDAEAADAVEPTENKDKS